MALSPGTRLGPYEIRSALGAGGIGEVYRARDTRLNRDVAIKVLPDLFASDPERLARFRREAQVLAALNHPNIAHIHGLEDSNGIHALVMELVEGPTLAERIVQGPTSLLEALPIAKQIGEALAAAHDQGIIHRDLKPANVKVREDGTVKVLDFGLAKLVAPEATAVGAGQVTQSPTVTSPAATLAGVILVVSPVVTMSNGTAEFDIGRDGTLVYAEGAGAAPARTLVWVDRQGHEEAIKAAPARSYLYPRLSPDGTRVALEIRDEEHDVWVWSLARQTLTRITSDPAIDQAPVWMPDGLRLVFTSFRDGGVGSLFRQAADGTGVAERLTESSGYQRPSAVLPDGMRLLFWEAARNTATDVMMLRLEKDRRVEPLIQGPLVDRNAEVSPDGQWLAYESNDSGQPQVFVRPFPDVNKGRIQVSTVGGAQVLWARNGQELFYIAPGGALMSVPVKRGTTWSAGTPTKLIETGYFRGGGGNDSRMYDVSPDGKRFLIIKQELSANQPGVRIVVVQHWLEELKRLVPTK